MREWSMGNIPRKGLNGYPHSPIRECCHLNNNKNDPIMNSQGIAEYNIAICASYYARLYPR